MQQTSGSGGGNNDCYNCGYVDNGVNDFFEGGALIGKGGYGCVFHPGINNNGTPMKSKKTVSKLVIKDKSSNKEIYTGKKLNKLLKKYNVIKSIFLPIISHKNIKVSTIKDKDIDKCTMIERKKFSKFVLLNMPFIDGVEFMDYIKQEINRSSKVINVFFQSYLFLLKSLHFLIQSKTVHFDLKGNNILYNKLEKLPTIIDFGLSINMEKILDGNGRLKISLIELQNEFVTFGPDYFIWSLEVHYLCYLLYVDLYPNNNNLMEIVNSFVENHIPLRRNYSSDFLNKYKKLCYEQLIKYNSIELMDRITLILNYWKTWDNYSLSCMYLLIMSYINLDGNASNDFMIFISKILITNMHPNPENRLSIIETMTKFKELLLNDKYNNIENFENMKYKLANNKGKVIVEINKDSKIIKNSKQKIKKMMKV